MCVPSEDFFSETEDSQLQDPDLRLLYCRTVKEQVSEAWEFTPGDEHKTLGTYLRM